jgi:HlyD family secretion protein
MLNILKNKKIRNWGIAVIAVLVIGLVVWSLIPAKATKTTADSKVVSLETAVTVSASGPLNAQPFAALEWKTSGVVETVNVKAGDLVKAGDILLALQPSSTSTSIVTAKSDLIQAQKDLEDLLKSDTARAQAAVDLKTAQDAYDKAKNYRTSLNGKTWLQRLTYTYIGPKMISVIHWVRAYADPTTIANADRDLALKNASLEDAQRAYDRLKDGPNTQDVAADQAKVDASQATVNMLYIIAPFDGKVLSVDNQVGDLVATADLSVNVADMNHLYVETEVDESDIAKVKLGNQVEATLDAVPGLTLTGQVMAINPVSEVISGLVKYKVRVDLDPAADGTFLPLGTTVNVVIQVKAPSKTLAVPISSVQNDSKGEYVWVKKADGTTGRVDVVSGEIVGNLVTVTGNLKEGDTLSAQGSSGSKTPAAGQ